MARSDKPAASLPKRTEAETQTSITALVTLLLQHKGPKKVDLAEELGMRPDSLTHSLTEGDHPRHRAWKVHEVIGLSRHYSISVEALVGEDEAEREEVLEELRNLALERLEEA